MRILVIGGTRFIGLQVVKQLDETGHEVTIFHRGQTEADLPSGIQHIHGDRQRMAVLKAAEDCRTPKAGACLYCLRNSRSVLECASPLALWILIPRR